MIFLYKIVSFHQSSPRASFGLNAGRVMNSVCSPHLYLSVSSKSCLLCVGWMKLHSITPITPTPFLSACYKSKAQLLVLNWWVKEAEETCNHLWLPSLAAHFHVQLYQPVLMIHHNPLMLFWCCIQKWCVHDCSAPS